MHMPHKLRKFFCDLELMDFVFNKKDANGNLSAEKDSKRKASKPVPKKQADEFLSALRRALPQLLETGREGWEEMVKEVFPFPSACTILHVPPPTPNPHTLSTYSTLTLLPFGVDSSCTSS